MMSDGIIIGAADGILLLEGPPQDDESRRSFYFPESKTWLGRDGTIYGVGYDHLKQLGLL